MTDAADFVRQNTRSLAPPLVPEILLRLATEVVPLWRKTEDELAEMGVPPPYWAFAWAGGQALARYLLDNPQLDQTLEAVFNQQPAGPQPAADGAAPQRRTLEVVPPGWHGQV